MPPQHAHSSSSVVEVPQAPDAPPVTPLSAGGCTVNLPGRWNQIRDINDQGDWSAESEDGTQTLNVLPMPWNATDIRDGLDAIIHLRRQADVEQNGPGVVLSETEFFNDSAWYMLSNKGEGRVMATMAKASPKLACVVYLIRNGGNSNDFRQYAKSVLRAVIVEQ